MPLFAKFVVILPVAPSTVITSSPAVIPMPFIRSTADIAAPLRPNFSLKLGIAGLVPSPQSQIEFAGLRPFLILSLLTGWSLSI